MITPKNSHLFAFDLDGTLLTTDKQLTQKTLETLYDIHLTKSIVAFASGRIKSSIFQYIDLCSFPIAVLSLNGAEVYMDTNNNFKKIFSSSLSPYFADYLCEHSIKHQIALNYYIDEKLFTVSNATTTPWINLYIQQTGSNYHFLDSFTLLKNKSPSKIIMVGSPDILDIQHSYFSDLWRNQVYICRTWDYYLEFLPLDANKGLGLKHLAEAYSIDLKNVIAFGDAENDIPMLQIAGISIAVKNASDNVKSAATRISRWSNDEDVITHEWSQLKIDLKL